MKLYRKILERKLKVAGYEKEEHKIEPVDIIHTNGFNRFLSEESEHFYDKLYYGYNSAVSSVYSVNKVNWNTDQNEESKEKVLTPETDGYMKNLFDLILLEMNSKEDQNKTSKSNGNSKANKFQKLLQQFLKKNKDSKANNLPIMNLDGIMRTRYFKVYYNIFKYYGPEIFENQVYQTIKECISNGLQNTEHPTVTKSLLSDIICAFLRTIKFFPSSPLFSSTFLLLPQLLSENDQFSTSEFLKYAI